MHNYGGSITVAPHQDAPRVEARLTSPDDPLSTGGSYHQGALIDAAYALGIAHDGIDDHITPPKALTYSAVWGCVQVIAQSLAGVGWHVFERAADDPRRKMPITENLAWTLDLQANPEMSAFTWREVMLTHALLWGSGYSEIERTGMGRLQWLWPIHPDRVTPYREGGRLWYEVDNGPGNRMTYLRPEDVFHLKGPSLDGINPLSVVSLARRSIQLGLREERFGNDFFGRGIMPGGLVTVPARMTKEARQEFRRSFEEVYAGSRNQHRIVVLSDGVTFTPAVMPNEDAQFLESRAFQVTEICRWFRVPPHKLADLSRATFSNIEEQERAFVGDCLLPWARRLESEADIKCLSFSKQGRKFTRLNLDALQRGNSQTQTDTTTKKVTSGILTVNEAREYFDLNPQEGGDTPLIQGAMVPLSQVVNPPEPEPEPQPAPQPTPPAPAPEDVQRVFGRLLADAFGRLLRVDADKARRANNKGRLAQHVEEWYDAPGAIARVDDALRPALESLALSLGIPAIEGGVWATTWAMSYVHWCRADLKAGVEKLGEWEDGRAATMARCCLDSIIPTAKEQP